MSLRMRLLLLTGLPLLLIMLAATAVGALVVQRSITTSVEDALRRETRSMAERVDTWAKQRISDVSWWAAQHTVIASATGGADEQATATTWLMDLTRHYPDFQAIHVALADGSVVSSSLPDQVGKLNLKGRSYLTEAIGGKTVISTPFKSSRTGRPVMAIAAPLRNQRGEPVGALTGVIDLSEFAQATIVGVQAGQGGYAYIVDREGTVIAHPIAEHILQLKMTTLDFGAQVMAAEDGLIRYHFKDRDRIGHVIRTPTTGWRVAVAGISDELMAPVRATVEATAGTALVGIAVLLFLLWLVLTWAVVRPVHSLHQVIEGIASGDLRKGAECVRRDEIGIMARSLDRTVAGIRSALMADRVDWDVVTRQSEARAELVINLEKASGTLTGISQRLAATAQETASQSQTVSSAAEQVASGVATVVAGAEEMTASINEISTTTQQAADISTQAKEHAGHVAQAMAKLDDSSKAIGDVVGTIAKIAQKTNLLALNASIEAASAGEHGRGFAVVAGEVKELARQTGEATSSIQLRIAGIQADTGAMSSALKTIMTNADRLHGFQLSVASAVEQQSSTTADMGRSLHEASAGVRQISQNVSGLAEAMEDITHMAEETKLSAASLGLLTARLAGRS